MNNVMVDLETLGTKPGSVILSIGAVTFDKTGIGEGFYVVVNSESCCEAGLAIDPDTEAWWSRQSTEARQVLIEAGSGGLPLAMALGAFKEYLSYIPGPTVWGNGADFDNPILAACYHAVGERQPWAPYNGRCFRTLKNLAREVPAPPRQGVYHNALDDAVTQALHAVEILRSVRITPLVHT